MKNKVHWITATFGCLCVLTLALLPLAASATSFESLNDDATATPCPEATATPVPPEA